MDEETIKIKSVKYHHTGFDAVALPSTEEIQNEKAQVAQAQMKKIAKKQFSERMKDLSGNALNKAYKHYCNVELKKPDELKREQKIEIIKNALVNLEDNIIDKLYLQFGSTGLTESGKKKEIRQVLKDATVEDLLYFVATFKPARKTATKTKKQEEPQTAKQEEPQTAETEDNGEGQEI